MKSTSDETTTGESPPERLPKGGDSERIVFTYNDAVADTILRLENIRKELELITERLRLIHEEFSMLPEIHEREVKQAKRTFGLASKTHVS